MNNPIVLPYPPSANRYWRHAQGRTYLSKEAIQYREDVANILLDQSFEPVDGDVALWVDIFRPQRSGDLDNFAKQLLDAMRGYLYHDDKQIVELHMSRYDDKANPRAEVMMRRVSYEECGTLIVKVLS